MRNLFRGIAIICCWLLVSYQKVELTNHDDVSSLRHQNIASRCSEKAREAASESEISPIILNFPDITDSDTIIDLGHMHFKEIVRIPWIINNDTKNEMKLLDISTDCSCVEVKPNEGLINSKGILEGYIDYKQGNLGVTRRSVIFRTSNQDVQLNIVSTKACDHYLSQNQISIKDDENVKVGFHALSLAEEIWHDHEISQIQFDPNYLEMINISPTSTQRFVEDAGLQLDYVENITTMTFRISPKCQIGRFEKMIKMIVSDKNGLLSDYVYEIPVYLTNYKNIIVKPSSVTFGVVKIDKTKLPLVRKVEISGLKERKVGNIKISPNTKGIEARLLTEGNTATVEVVISNPPRILDSQLLISLVGTNNSDKKIEELVIPLMGYFKN